MVTPGEKSYFPSSVSKVSNKRKALRRRRRSSTCTMITRKSSRLTGPLTAEPRRRRKLIQHFLALSSVVQALNKMDLDSILEGAIKYMKQLEERLEMLEEQKKKKSGDEATVFVEKTWVVSADGDTSSFQYEYSKESLPEIEARADQEKNVLIKIHCENKKGYIGKIISEVEKLQLNIINITALPFTDYFLDITVSAQMSDMFCTTMKDLKRYLQLALAS